MDLPNVQSMPDWKIDPIFEFRYRYERRVDRDFYDLKNDNRFENTYRTRLGFTAQSNKGQKVQLVYQNGLTDTYTLHHSAVANSDLQQAWIEFPDKYFSYTVGRQLYKMGNGRLVGPMTDWSNLGRSFDGARAVNKKWEAFWFKEGIHSYYNPFAQIAGAAMKDGKSITAVLYKNDKKQGIKSDSWTVDEQLTLKGKGLTWQLEAAGQFGRIMGKDLRAWYGLVNVSKPVGKAKVYAEATAASGGSGPKTVSTFDQLYPSAPAQSQLHIQMGNRNVITEAIGVEYPVTKKLKLTSTVWNFDLYNESDGFYNAGGTINTGPKGAYVDATGSSGRSLGQMGMLEADFQCTKQSSFQAGVGIWFPGNFIKNMNDGVGTKQTWGYVQYKFKF